MPRPLIGRERLEVRSFRIEPAVWEEATRVAKQQGRGIAELVRIAVMQYLERNAPDPAMEGISDTDRIQLGMAHAAIAHSQGLPLATGLCSECDKYFV